METRREKEVVEMKDNIINAAVELIITDGYEKLSMRKIAKAIGYSPTTLYLYYSDKADIIAALSQKIVSNTIETALEKFNQLQNEPMDSVLNKVLSHTIISICSQPNLGIALIRSGENRLFIDSEQEGPLSASVFIQGILEQGKSQGIFSSATEETSGFLLISIVGFAQYCLENTVYNRKDFGQLTDNFVKTIIYGIS